MQHGGAGERPDRDYPFYLTTGRMLAQYQSGTQTRRIAALIVRAGDAEAELHPRPPSRQGWPMAAP